MAVRYVATSLWVGKNFHLLDLAEQVADEVMELLQNSRPRLLHHFQLEASAESIPANIREGYGRTEGPDRNRYLRYSRGSADETKGHLRSNFVANRIPPVKYWRLHNRLCLIRKMINAILGE